MIVFLGDSFTWGQGLFLEKWNQDKTISEKTYRIPPEFNHELISYKDDEFRKKFHYPNLVSKNLNKSYSTIWGNGGSNQNIISILQNLENQFYSGITEVVDFFVIQFTCPSRSGYLPSNKNIELEIKELDTLIKSRKKKWIGYSWRPELGNVLKNKFSENYIPLIYNSKEYTNFEEILYDDKNIFTLDRKYKNIYDSHFSLEGHEFIAESILNKLKNSHIY